MSISISYIRCMTFSKKLEQLFSVWYYLIFKICCSISRWHDKEERKHLTLKLVLKIICLYHPPPSFLFSKVNTLLLWGRYYTKLGNTNKTLNSSSSSNENKNMNNNNICNIIYKLLCIAWNMVVWLIVLWQRWRWWWSGYAHIYINACIPSNCLEIK